MADVFPHGVTIREPGAALVCCATATREAETYVASVMRAKFALTPPGPGRRAGNGEIDMIWQEPGRWLLRAPARLAAELIEAFDRRDDLLLSDFSHGLALFEISGPRCRDTLSRSVPLDLDPDVFGADAAAATLVHHAGVWLWRRGADVFEMACERSFADHIREHLVDAAREFGLSAQRPRTWAMQDGSQST